MDQEYEYEESMNFLCGHIQIRLRRLGTLAYLSKNPRLFVFRYANLEHRTEIPQNCNPAAFSIFS